MKACILIVAISLILAIFKEKSKKEVKGNTQKKMTLQISPGFFGLGLVEGVMVFSIFLWDFTAKDRTITVDIFLLILAMVGVILMLYSINWRIIVKDDDIEVRNFLGFTKHCKFSEIERGKLTRGGMKIYMKGKYFKAFNLEPMAEGVNLFVKRMEKEGIPIEKPKVMEEDD